MVCGVDGDTYTNECAAWANGVVMDYAGHCRSVGNYHCKTVFHLSAFKIPNVSEFSCILHKMIDLIDHRAVLAD